MEFYNGTIDGALVVVKLIKGSYKENLLPKVGLFFNNIEK
jgi:hypothetical protein